ncbi:MAG TPA: hypothetical protein VF144_18995 [Chitinophagaceae bacterium]
MEVHAHTHTPRKKWTHYFWEFLMLFLAVFCGFLAENQREHMIENQREKKYIRSLYEDLKRDSVELASVIDYRNGLSESARYLITALDTADKIKYTDSIYHSAYHLTANPRFEYSNATVEQLKSSGLLRLIRKQEVAENIVAYDILVSRYFTREEAEKEIRPEYRKAIAEILDAKFLVLFEVMDTKEDYQPINLPFLSTNPEKLNRIKGMAAQFLNLNGITIFTLERIVKKRNDLATLLRKEYQLK